MFQDQLKEDCKKTGAVTTLQMNITQKCNLRCAHCHLMAGSENQEMSKEVMEDALKALDRHSFQVVDITGGEPTTHPRLVWLMQEALQRVDSVYLRTNAVAMEQNEELMAFLETENRVTLIVSLPCYTGENVDAQRGAGTFEKIIPNLRKLNAMGYGREKELNLVYNPGGAFLPGPQAGLEADYKKELAKEDVHFHRLFTITNMPLGFFAKKLEQEGKKDEYMELLKSNFNPETQENMMCRFQISVDADGDIYDCDFHQVTDTKAEGYRNIREVIEADDLSRSIVFREYCYGCTAGAGSSCGGALDA